MLSEPEKQKLIAFTLMARRYTMPLLEESETTAAILGTATLFAVNSNHYLITAAHVIAEHVKNKRTDRICVPLGLNRAAVTNLGNHFVSFSENFDTYDAAIIRLDQPELVSALKESWNCLSVKNIAAINPKHKRAFIAGYPQAVSATSSDFKMSSLFISVATTFLQNPPPKAEDVRPDLDVFLAHEEGASSVAGKSVELPKLQGISGASVWQVLPDSEGGLWNAENHVRAVAVEVAYREGSYIRTKSWLLVAKLFEAIDSAAADDIKKAIATATGI